MREAHFLHPSDDDAIHGKDVLTKADPRQAESKVPEVFEAKSEPPARIQKTIMVDPVRARYLDDTVVSFEHYNSFNYSLLAGQKHDVHLTLGVTSANRGEGTTLAASNLAVALTLGYKRKTVLVDLNFRQPRVHKIFGTPVGPGLLDALEGGPIHVSSTVMDNLFVLPAGPAHTHASGRNGRRAATPVGVEHTSEFGDVIHALEQEYDFVIVDMPAINLRQFPILFLSQLEGVFVVIEAGKTKRHDIDKMFRHLNKQQVMGYVFNRVTDEDDE